MNEFTKNLIQSIRYPTDEPHFVSGVKLTRLCVTRLENEVSRNFTNSLNNSQNHSNNNNNNDNKNHKTDNQHNNQNYNSQQLTIEGLERFSQFASPVPTFAFFWVKCVFVSLLFFFCFFLF